MKLLSSFVVGSTWASHFRGATWLTSVNKDGDMEFQFPQTWRRGSSGFTSYCSEAEQTSLTLSKDLGDIDCVYLDGGSCGTAEMRYRITFADGDNSSGYCYGFGEYVFSPAPSKPFSLEWGGNAWVPFKSDTGGSVSGGTWTIRGEYYDITNNAPAYKLPPLWLIMSSCDGQFIDLNPSDLDGDRIKCRWATQAEGDTAYYRSSHWPSLTLDEENCIVHYTGSLDVGIDGGVKPIALMIEDFDSNGQVRSKTPIQFLAQVWQPNITVPPSVRSNGKRAQDIRKSNNCSPNCYPEFPHDDHDHEDSYGERKRREAEEILTRTSRSTGAAPYCDPANWPQIDGDMPQDGDELDCSTGYVELTLKASSVVSTVAKFVYQGPLGFRCSELDANMESHCEWTLTDEQKAIAEHQFCFQAVDHAGLQSERRCVTYTTAAKFFVNIDQMAKAVLTGDTGTMRYHQAEDYGCAGRGHFDPFSRTIGMQVDGIDKDFFQWKKCVQCANGFKSIPEYVFWVNNSTCTGTTNMAEAVCECDRRLVGQLVQSVPNNFAINYGASKCQKAHIQPPRGECCKHSGGLYDMINPFIYCCGSNGPKDVGTCANGL